LSEKSVRKRVCVTLTKPYLEALDRLVREGVYASHAELVKDALRRLFTHYGFNVFLSEEEREAREAYRKLGL